MKKKELTVILNYGCPRSGTTFTNIMLNQGINFITGKIAEGSCYHPIRNKNGLFDLSYTFRNYNVFFLRTVRNPLNIFESFAHAKKITNQKNTEIDPDFYSFSKQTTESIKNMISEEKKNTEDQIKRGVKIFELNFDNLGNADYLNEKLSEISNLTMSKKENFDIFYRFVRDNYNKKPVRRGRLSDNAMSCLTKDEALQISKWYEDLCVGK